MSFPWEVIESGSLSPEEVMAKDRALLAELDPCGPAFLHFYDWNAPCLTYGYFTDPSRYLYLETLESFGLQKARRPTGGGVIFHLSDLAFSVLIPASHPRFSLNTLENYVLINQKVAEAIEFFTLHSLQPQLLNNDSICSDKECQAFCMAKPTQYDIMIQGKKVGGAAQRRTKQGLLHQGSLSLLFPPTDLLLQVLKGGNFVVEAMRKHSYCLLPEETTAQELQQVRSEFKRMLVAFICL